MKGEQQEVQRREQRFTLRGKVGHSVAEPALLQLVLDGTA